MNKNSNLECFQGHLSHIKKEPTHWLSDFDMSNLELSRSLERNSRPDADKVIFITESVCLINEIRAHPSIPKGESPGMIGWDGLTLARCLESWMV
jgi:hypothetical protein